MKILFVIAFAVAAAVSVNSSAQAKQDQWCAVRQGSGEYGDCHYSSFNQCKASTSSGETCIRNALKRN